VEARGCVNVWNNLNGHLHVAISTLGLLKGRLTHPRDLDDIEDAINALNKAAGIVRRLANSNGDAEMAEIETQEAEYGRRASDVDRKQRTITGWIGIAMCVAAFLGGIARGSEVVQLAAFLGAMVAGNRLPFESVRGLIPWGK
jgi:hypothetical protein